MDEESKKQLLQSDGNGFKLEITQTIETSHRRKVGAAKSSTGKYSPVIRFSASWLAQLGYKIDTWFEWTICDGHIEVRPVDGPFPPGHRGSNADDEGRPRETLLVPPEPITPEPTLATIKLEPADGVPPSTPV